MSNPADDWTAADICACWQWTRAQLEEYMRVKHFPRPDYEAADGPRWRQATVDLYTNARARDEVAETLDFVESLEPDLAAIQGLSREEPE